LERELGVTREQILSFFRIIGEAGVAVEAIPGRLFEIAERYKIVLAQAEARRSDNSEMVKLKVKLRAALAKPDLEGGDAILAEVLEAQDLDIERRTLEAAATCAQRGDIAMTRLRYREAAAHFGAAASRLPVSREKERFEYLHDQAGALYREGKDYGVNSALRSAEQVCRDLLGLCPREPRLVWMLQNSLGTVLVALGERGDGEALQRSIAAYEAALEASRERAPLAWAMTQNNLGNALRILGKCGDKRTLWRAVAACDAALEERTRERDPLARANTQNNLGNALQVVGERGNDRALQRAVMTSETALNDLSR